MARTNVPKFGNWDTEENISYTTYFENARRVSSSEKVNPNSSPDNSKLGARKGTEATRVKHNHIVRQEDVGLPRPYDSPLRHDVGRKASVNTRPGAVSSDTPKRAARANGGVKIGAKGSPVSSPSSEKKGSSEGAHGLAPSTPGRSRLRSVPRGNETPDRGASVPKFGEWDETDPSSAEGFTHIFNKVKEERHGSVGKTPDTATRTQQHSDSHKHYRSKKSKLTVLVPLFLRGAAAFLGKETDAFCLPISSYCENITDAPQLVYVLL
ncbi:RPM1-interacting protein 4 [Bienertia sinuspersici]